MAQQLAIIVLVDVANALQSRTLDGNVYFFDNMKCQGSTGEGTGSLVTVIPGTYWADGSQATEQVLNWIPTSLGSIPPTVPHSYHADRARQSDQEALRELEVLTDQPGSADIGTQLAAVRRRVGTRAGRRRNSRSIASSKLIDVTGHIVDGGATQAHNYPAPVITDVTGLAVDEKIIYPAQYGSPDLVSDGWYWSATVDTSRPGTYAYSMRLQLHELTDHEGEPTWEPVDLICESALKITTDPKRNAFTGAGLGLLPMCSAPSS